MHKAAFPACLTIAHALLLASVAGAQSIEAARTAYAEGRFVEAAELAAALETSVAYALAAESLGIHGYYVAENNDKPTLFDRGILLAQEAIRLDPVNPEAHFQLAHVMGRKAQIAGVMEPIRGGYVQKVRAAIEAGAAAESRHGRSSFEFGRLACGSGQGSWPAHGPHALPGFQEGCLVALQASS